MLSLRLAAASSLLIVAVACGGGYSTPPSAPSPTPLPTPTTGASGSSIAIPVGAAALGNKAFAPDDLNIAVGTTVTWMNTDSIAHTSTSDTTGFDSGILAPGGQFSFAFETAGTFSYHCAIHPGMIGTVVVR